MKSEVDFTFGFSCSIVATGTPDFVEMTPKVSPACTVQNRWSSTPSSSSARSSSCVETVLCGGVAVADVVAARRAACRPERMSRTAIVAASRNAAGATYRRQSSRGTYQPDAAQISRLSRAASAPAASR